MVFICGIANHLTIALLAQRLEHLSCKQKVPTRNSRTLRGISFESRTGLSCCHPHSTYIPPKLQNYQSDFFSSAPGTPGRRSLRSQVRRGSHGPFGNLSAPKHSPLAASSAGSTAAGTSPPKRAAASARQRCCWPCSGLSQARITRSSYFWNTCRSTLFLFLFIFLAGIRQRVLFVDESIAREDHLYAVTASLRKSRLTNPSDSLGQRLDESPLF